MMATNNVVCSRKLYISFLVSIMLLFMIQPSMASWGWSDENILIDIKNYIGELVEVERERNAALKEQNEILKLVKNKLSDIAVLQAVGKCWPIYAESEEDSGFRSNYPSHIFPRTRDMGGYYYFNDNLKPYQNGK